MGIQIPCIARRNLWNLFCMGISALVLTQMSIEQGGMGRGELREQSLISPPDFDFDPATRHDPHAPWVSGSYCSETLLSPRDTGRTFDGNTSHCQYRPAGYIAIRGFQGCWSSLTSVHPKGLKEECPLNLLGKLTRGWVSRLH